MRRIALAAVLSLCAAASFGAREAQAKPGQDKTNIYFSDRTFTEAVGEELVLSCYGAAHMMIWGVRSDFYQVDSASCDDGGGGGGGSESQCVVCTKGAGCFVVPCAD